MYEEYNPLEIPCDWNIARKHALARRTGPDTKDEDQEQKPEACQCCGFEIERSQIAFCDNPKELKFLGAGFPLFYNYLKFCILLLGLQSIVGILNMYGNYLGTYCSTEIYNEESKQLELPCQQSILLQLSLANKINNEYAIQLIQKCNLLLIFIVMILLVLFRREQKKLDTQIDESQLTPSDYTIVVKNIPKTLPVNYRWELVNMFQNFALQDSNFQIKVTKVVLVYDTTELQQIEEKIAELIYKKKQTLIRTKMNFQANELQEINLEIKSLENKQEEVENEYFYTNKRFAGIAFVSFESEDMKDKILEHNKDTILERIQSYFYHGKLPNIQEDQLQWHQQKIFVEQAPEPNDVDWEFIHCVTTDKIFARIKAIVLCLLLQAGTFTIIYLISFHLIKLTDQLHEESLEGKIDQEKVMHARFFSFGINLSIVLFNKFSVGYILHMVTDLEKISTKTKFQISFARKLTFSLFMNAALISYIIDILIFKNVYGFGGFIFNETLIFVLNALLPPFIWFVDPWTLIKNYKRDREIEKGTDCLLTQQEANQLMEQVDYQSAKRYADIIKTMWFTFFFGTAIPLGIFSSFFGLMLYYLVDKYNLIRRRTVKESISKELSLEMISLLDLIVIFGPLGCLTVSFSFYGSFEYLDLLQLMFALIFILIPFDSCIDALFPIKNLEEPISYEEGSIDFDTDYDRENPITKKKAIKEFQMDLQIKHQQQLDLKKSREQELNNHDQSYIPDKFR